MTNDFALPAGLVVARAAEVVAGDVMLVHSSFQPVLVALAFDEAIELTTLTAHTQAIGRMMSFEITARRYAVDDAVTLWRPGRKQS